MATEGLKQTKSCKLVLLPPSARVARIHNAGWNMVVLRRYRLQHSLFRPILPSLHRPQDALGSNPSTGRLLVR